jgi:hypothetical protein
MLVFAEVGRDDTGAPAFARINSTRLARPNAPMDLAAAEVAAEFVFQSARRASNFVHFVGGLQKCENPAAGLSRRSTDVVAGMCTG